MSSKQVDLAQVNKHTGLTGSGTQDSLMPAVPPVKDFILMDLIRDYSRAGRCRNYRRDTSSTLLHTCVAGGLCQIGCAAVQDLAKR